MKNVSNQSLWADQSFIKLKDNDWLGKQRIAGKVAAGAISLLVNFVKNHSDITLLDMSREAEKYILERDCSCSFKNYKGFPEAVCISINKQLVHGIPKDLRLNDGDIVSFDLGATYKGVVADTATTVIYGDAKQNDHVRLIKTTKEALKKGIEVAKVGNRIGDIGYAIYRCAKAAGYNTINTYGGHGICMYENGEQKPHASPFVPNKSTPNEGIRIQPGLTIAIEPLLTIGPTETFVDNDKWTVCTKNISCHTEHTIYIHNNHTEILTLREENDIYNI